MFKKIFLIICLSTFLTSCGDDEISTSGLSEISGSGYTIEAPSNWEQIDNNDNSLPEASVGEIELAISSTNFVSGFANNLLILSDDLQRITTSKEYSMLNNIGAETDYIDYREIESKEITFADEEVGMLYTFEAKYNMDTQKLKFLQTAHICNGTKAYFMTIALPTSIDDTSKYEYLLSTFKCN